MKIKGDDPLRLLGAYFTRAKEASQRPGVRSERGRNTVSDTIEISGLALHFREISRIVGSVPEVNADRVQEVRRKVEADQYRVQGEQLAERLIERAILDELL